MRRVREAEGRPVFVDRTGQRRWLALVVGLFVAVALMVNLALLAASFASATAPPAHPLLGPARTG